MISDNIRKRCRDKGITICALEQTLGIGNGVIARWDYGKNGPALNLVKRVADYFGVTVDDLLNGDRHNEDRNCSRS